MQLLTHYASLLLFLQVFSSRAAEKLLIVSYISVFRSELASSYITFISDSFLNLIDELISINRKNYDMQEIKKD